MVRTGDAFDGRRLRRSWSVALTLGVLVATLAAGSVVAAPAPNTTIVSGPSGPHPSRTAAFSFTSTRAGSSFQCKIDGKAWAKCSSGKSYSKLKQGSHTFRVRAKKGGKVDKSPAVRTFNVDTVAPNTTITGGPTGTTLDIRPEFTFSASQAGTTFECALDQATFAACSSPHNVPPPYVHQPHTFAVRARDAAGNVDASPATRTFTIEPFSIGGGPYGEAAAALYFPSFFDLDVAAVCGVGGTDCPGGTPVAPSPDQLHLETVSMGVIHQVAAGRFDITATLDVSTTEIIKVALPTVGDCDLALDSFQGTDSFWRAHLQLDFAYGPTNGDALFTPSNVWISDIQSGDWTVGGNLLCTITNGITASFVEDIVIDTLMTHWATVGNPLCERPAPALVGKCPD